MFGISFCYVKEKLPPLEAMAEEFRAQARPQPSAQPRLSDLALEVRHSGIRRRDETVDVEREFEIPSCRPQEAGNQAFRLLKEFTNIDGPAGGVRSDGAFSDSSKRIWTA
jgi:hypothetical protein